MTEVLTRCAVAGAGVALLSALAVGLLRRAGRIGPLVESERRWPLWVRVPTLAVWISAVLFGSWTLPGVLPGLHEWVGKGLAGLVGLALTALGVGVALL